MQDGNLGLAPSGRRKRNSVCKSEPSGRRMLEGALGPADATQRKLESTERATRHHVRLDSDSGCAEHFTETSS